MGIDRINPKLIRRRLDDGETIKRTLREIPVAQKILDPFVMVNQTGNEIHVFINRDLADELGPARVEIRPDEYFVFPHMNYHIYAGHREADGRLGEKCHPTMLKGNVADAFLKRIPPGLSEAKSSDGTEL